MKKISFLLAFVISSFAFACLNYSIVGTDVNGKRKTTHAMEEHHRGLHIYDLDKSMIEKNGKYDLEEYKKTKNLDNYLNYATSLVYLGDYDKAISIFKEIEEKQSDKYELASNLGTAYELTGDNQNALKWIQKALKLNKDSHHGSEWIHIKILQNKLKQIEIDNLLGFDFGNEKIPTSEYSTTKLEEFVNDLSYQLSERTQFVKPKESIVARLYFELGNALALTDNLETAQKAYRLSKQYGFSNPLLDERMTHFSYLIKQNKESGKHLKNEEYEPADPEEIVGISDKISDFPNWIIVSVILVLLGGLYFILRSKLKNQ